MFKRLLFGNEESKLNFKTSTTSGIARLYTDPAIPASDLLYWRTYLQFFESASDVFSLLSVSDVRRALATHPENIATLVHVLVQHLESLQHDPDFSPIPHDAAPVAAGLIAGLGRNVSDWVPNVAGKRPKDAVSNDTRNRVLEALNCCRLLSRILPVVMEGDHDTSCNVSADGSSSQSGSLLSNEFEKQLLWSEQNGRVDGPSLHSGTASRSTSGTAAEENQFVIADEEEEDKSTSDPLGANESLKPDARPVEEIEPSGPTLGERLTAVAVDLLFYSGFTIPWTEEKLSLSSHAPVSSSRVHFAIWERGIGSSVDLPGTTKQHEVHRVEILRLLLVLFSKSIYVPAHLQTSTENPSSKYAATSLDRNKVLPLLCSLLNVSAARVRGDRWLGGLTSIPSGLMKDRLALGGEDIRHSTTMLSLQLLNVLVGYELPLPEEDPALALASPNPQQQQRPALPHISSRLSITSTKPAESGQAGNLFRLYFSKLHRQADFTLLSDGIFAIISQRLSPAALLNPANTATDTSSAGPYVPETLLLLWRLLRHNSKFRNFLLDDSVRSPTLLSHLLYHALNNKDSAARQGLVRLAVFLLQDISCDRAFAVNVCKAGSGEKAKISGGQRWGIAAGGGGSSALPSVGGGGSQKNQSQAPTGADILIQAIYSLIASTRSTLSALYPPLIITITNLSPYFKNLSILSSNRLLALFTSFSNPGFLLADEGNPRLLFYLLESFNLTIQHGFNRNPNLIYAIVRLHSQVENLANFTLRRGIAEMRRMRKKAGVVESSLVGTPTSEVAGGGQAKKGVNSGTGTESTNSTEQASQTGDESRGEFDGQSVDQAPSEKARGKMRRTSVSSETTARGTEVASAVDAPDMDEEDRLVAGFNEEELHYAASTIGRNGFVPTQAWVTSWQKGLPLDTLQLTLLELVPKVQDLCRTISGKNDADDRVLAFLREQSLSDILPAASAVQPRHFRWTAQVSIWLLSYLWGLIYLSSSLPLGIFNGSNARLFQLRIQEGYSSPRGSEQLALLNVGNMVFGGLSQVLGLGHQQTSTNQPEGTAQTQRRQSSQV